MKIITFYSYKGGVGRTMCLANIAVLLAKWGHKVLMVDWDWEAPGLERYFVPENFNGKANSTPAGIDLSVLKEKPGLVDLLTERKKDSWKEALISIPIPDAREPLHFISAGRRDDDYFKRVRDFNVETFYTKKKGGQYIEDIRRAWWDAYDFILIDSRTGVSEINGISTIQMPNLIVLLFTATNQSFEGALDIAYRSSSAQQKLPYDRGKLLFLPILSRLESTTELELTNSWINHFAENLTELYKYWLPTLNSRVTPDEFLKMTKIPHVPYYTFGEKLAVIKDGTSDPSSMGYAYEGIASLIANKLERVEEFVEKRDIYIGGSPQKSTELIKEVKKYIGNQEIIPAIEVLEDYFKSIDSMQDMNDLIILKVRYKNLLKDYKLDIVNRSQFNIELEKIMLAILNIADSLYDTLANTGRLLSQTLRPRIKNTE